MPQHGGQGNYGLGLVYAREQLYEKAIEQFQESIRLNPDFIYGRADLAYAYADAGQMDAAVEQLKIIAKTDPALADTVSRYLYRAEAPRIEFASTSSTFPHYFGPYTPLSALDTYLLNANTSKTFTMVFQFSKEMDRASVGNPFHWNISRSTRGDPGQAYNFGQDVPQTEVTLEPFPELGIYDAENFRATVTFRIHQNAAANGTIVPSHLVFKFSGIDKFGNRMDVDADEYCDFIDIH